jgi:cobalt/nickel transport system permease protein
MAKNKHFIERSIMGALTFFRDSVSSDTLASQRGFLQDRDPRIKAVTILLLILAVLFTRDISVLIFLYAFVVLLVLLCRIDLIFFLKRTWIFIPLFSLFVVIPALFSFVTPGRELWGFGILGFRLAITHEGLAGALLFVTRVVTSVSLAILLTLTTRHNDLLRALRILGIPQLFVMTLGMCYRYIYLFAEIVERTHTAIKSRVGLIVHNKKGREIVTWNMASLWMRSYQLNNQVYNAMLSRGYSGEPRVLAEFKAVLLDWVWLSTVIVMFGVILYLTYFILI